MKDRIAIYPILGVAGDWLDEPFNLSVLPVEILADVTVEKADVLFKTDSFDIWKTLLAEHKLKSLQRVRFAIVCRYDEFSGVSGKTDAEAEAIVRLLAWIIRDFAGKKRKDALKGA